MHSGFTKEAEMKVNACPNCNMIVEVDTHGRCVKCGTEHVLQVEQELVDITPEAIVEKTNVLLDVLQTAEYEFSPQGKAGIFLLIARQHKAEGFSLGHFLENAISMWDLNTQIVQGEQMARESRQKARDN